MEDEKIKTIAESSEKTQTAHYLTFNDGLQIILQPLPYDIDQIETRTHPLHSFSFSERTSKCVNPFLSALEAMSPT